MAKAHSVCPTSLRVLLDEFQAALHALRIRRAAVDLQELRPGIQRHESPRFHRQQRLDRFGPDSPADDLGPPLPVGKDVRAEVVDLGHVPGVALEEDHNRILSHGSANRPLQIVDVVGRDPAGAGRGVAGEVDHAAEQLARAVPRAQHAHGRIGRAGVLEHLGIVLAGMRVGHAVLHAQPAIERHPVFLAGTGAAAGLDLGLVGGTDGLDDLVAHFVHIARVGAGRLFVGQAPDQLRGVVVLPGLHDPQRTRRVRMRSPDQHRLGANAASAGE